MIDGNQEIPAKDIIKNAPSHIVEGETIKAHSVTKGQWRTFKIYLELLLEEWNVLKDMHFESNYNKGVYL